MYEEARISELLKPRYKVQDDWPFRKDFEVGEIIQLSFKLMEEWHFHHEITHQNYGESFFTSYPNIFKKLPWHEDRKPEEMPEYVKNKCDPGQPFNVYEVKGYTGCGKVVEFKDGSKGLSEYWLPATKTEYDQYIKTKQK